MLFKYLRSYRHLKTISLYTSCNHGNRIVQYSTNSNDGIKERKTPQLICDEWIKKFKSCSIPEPNVSAELIVAHVLGFKKFHQVPPVKEITDEQLKRIYECCQRRLQRCPVQYITGKCDFHNLTLKMREPVFIPRPETEELAKHISDELEAFEPHTGDTEYPTFLEIGCGTGALSLYLLHKYPEITGIAVDKNVKACDLTRENAVNLGLLDRLKILNMDITHADSVSRLKELSPFEVILSNPPYMPKDETETLEAEVVRYEDHVALNGGVDGLDIIRCILRFSSSLLKQNGNVWLEVEKRHPHHIQNMINNGTYPGLTYMNTYQDPLDRVRFCQLKRSRE